MKSHLWKKPCEDRRLLIGRSDARIIMGDDKTALMHSWSERPGLAKLEQPSNNPSHAQPRDHANARPCACPIRAAHAKFVAAIAGRLPRAIPLDVDAADLEDRADHFNKVLNALSIYVTTILDDTAQNVPGGLDLHQFDAVLSDLASDVTGTIRLAAAIMAAGRVA